MSVPRVVPVVILGAVAAAVVGAVAIVERVAGARRAPEPAAAGTPQVEGRLPIGLWPSNGTEPMVGRGIRGWREVAAAIYHADTDIDDAARARAIVIAEQPRREQDARRELALEAHVLRGAYEPALVAAAWLSPWPGDHSGLAAFGLGETTRATLRSVEQVAADPDLLVSWRREFGLDVVDPRVTREIVRATPTADLGRLWAVLLDLAEGRVRARRVPAHTSRG
jgi:hypothetical protein